jgi:tRNA uracil 4-sulfurtransferase
MVLLIRFGEIALKSRYVRRQLRDRLIANIQDLFAAEGTECVTEADEARVYVHVDDVGAARAILARVFGIVSMSPAIETRAALDAIRSTVLEEAARIGLTSPTSFAIRARRVGDQPFTSQDLARDLGAAVQRAHHGVRVDLGHPDVEIHVEVRRNRAFVFREIWPGPGGLPLGSQGRGLALVEDDAGLVAAWMGMKRGCRLVVASSDDGKAAAPLRRWDVHLKMLTTDGVNLEELVRLARAEAVFVGTRGDQFSPEGRPSVPVPVFEPVIGLAADEIENLARRIREA